MPDVPFEQLLIRNYQSISEENWMQEVSAISEAPVIFPVQRQSQIAPLACTKEGRRLLERHFAVVLQDSPAVVIGILNPFSVTEVMHEVASAFPAKLHCPVLLTPHSFVRLASLAERDATDFKSEWGENVPDWCDALEFHPETFTDTSAIVEELWTSKVPVIPADQIDEVAKIPGVDNALMLMKTALHIWVVTANPREEMLKDRLMQREGRTPLIFAVGPQEFRRLKESLEMRSVGVVVNDELPLHVQSWGSAQKGELVYSVQKAAIQMGASDIHIDPKEDRVRVRFRIDGKLYEQSPIAKNNYTVFVRDLKIQGSMKQDVQGVIQDGAGWISVNNVRYDLRHGLTIVDGGGEAIVTRIFSSKIPDMSSLGFSLLEVKTIRWFLDQESGMVVMSGPTGSGKTTTLYSLMKEISAPDIDIVTIEQPVEKYFPDAKQISVREDGHLTFTSALRSILRHDPDVILIGEIRDAEGCSKAMEAASTGHLVFTTTHANDAASVIERLVSAFGADRMTLSEAVKLTIAQRLVPKLCRFCKRIRDIKPKDIEYFAQVDVARPIIADPVGCPACKGTGYMGRTVVMEMLPFDDAVRAMIVKKVQVEEIVTYIRNRGFKGLAEQAVTLLLTGEISLESARLFIRKPLN